MPNEQDTQQQALFGRGRATSLQVYIYHTLHSLEHNILRILLHTDYKERAGREYCITVHAPWHVIVHHPSIRILITTALAYSSLHSCCV